MLRDRRAVSKVVGTVLLVAIVIALAALLGGMATGVSDQLQEPAPQLYTEFEYDDDVGDAAEEYGLDVEGVNEAEIDEVRASLLDARPPKSEYDGNGDGGYRRVPE